MAGVYFSYLIPQLDLQGNQIDSVPEPAFWASMTALRVAYLHDNLIGDSGALRSISASENLNVLTLFNNPLVLHPYYRHRAVNMIWSLVVLDRHIVADEEIIEGVLCCAWLDSKMHPIPIHCFLCDTGALFGGRFTAMSATFSVQAYHPSLDVRLLLS